jgi:hypothetical protein
MAERKIPKWFTTYIPQEVQDGTLFRFEVKVAGQKFSVDLRADLDVDYTAVEEQLEDTPAIFSYWSTIYAELKSQTAIMERRIKARRGLLASELLKEVTKAGGKVTDKQMNTVIEGDEELNRMETALIVLEKHTGKMYFMLQAIQMKAENLRSLSGFAKIDRQQTR